MRLRLLALTAATAAALSPAFVASSYPTAYADDCTSEVFAIADCELSPGCTGKYNVCTGYTECHGEVNICPNAYECKASSINVCRGGYDPDRG